MAEFDQANHWLIDRGDGRPSVNLVVLSFVNPLKMLDPSDTGLFNMIPAGMTQDVVDYFKSRGVRVMLSIGGITYTDDWDAALAKNPTGLGLNAAAVAGALGGGHRDRLREDHQPQPRGPGGFHRCLPFAPALRSDRQQPGRAPDHRPGRRRSLADRDHPPRHRQLAHQREPGPGLRQRHGVRHVVRNACRLAGAHQRQAELRASRPAPGARQAHRWPVPEGQRRQLQQLRLLGAEGGRRLRPDGSARRRRRDRRHARLHVLGGRVSFGATRLHRNGTAEHLRRRHGRWRHHLRQSPSPCRRCDRSSDSAPWSLPAAAVPRPRPRRHPLLAGDPEDSMRRPRGRPWARDGWP